MDYLRGITFEHKYQQKLMEKQSYFIEYNYKNKQEVAEVTPCCQEDNVYYYDVSIRNEYQFTVSPSPNDERGTAWKISFKNADKQVDPELIEIIGEQIQMQLLLSH